MAKYLSMRKNKYWDRREGDKISTRKERTRSSSKRNSKIITRSPRIVCISFGRVANCIRTGNPVGEETCY